MTPTNEYADLNGKLALVTGASSGLGAHFAQVLSKRGCTVALLARREQSLQQLSEQIAEAGGTSIVLAVDVTDRDAVESCFEQLRASHGYIDILVNNAGIANSATFLEADFDKTANVFAVNQMAVWHVAQLACKQMHEAGKGGSVINIASVLGSRVVKGLASYATSKAAVIQMTKAMALEMARYGIRVNAIAPGYCQTEMNDEYLSSEAGQTMVKENVPMRRVAELHELDGVLLLLASNQGSYITGAAIPVDGGYLVGP